MHSATLRMQLEDSLRDALKDRWPDPFRRLSAIATETAPAGLEALDALTGGLPRGQITEVTSAVTSGQTSLLHAALAQFTMNEECCAFLDPAGAFDPASAAETGVHLERLLWVRTGGRIERTFKAADWILQGGGFGLVAVDLGALPIDAIRDIPRSAWLRWRRVVENTATVLLVMTRTPAVKTCAGLGLRLETVAAAWSSRLFLGLEVRAVVLHSRRNPAAAWSGAGRRLHLESAARLRAVRPEAASRRKQTGISGVAS